MLIVVNDMKSLNDNKAVLLNSLCFDLLKSFHKFGLSTKPYKRIILLGKSASRLSGFVCSSTSDSINSNSSSNINIEIRVKRIRIIIQLYH